MRSVSHTTGMEKVNYRIGLMKLTLDKAWCESLLPPEMFEVSSKLSGPASSPTCLFTWNHVTLWMWVRIQFTPGGGGGGWFKQKLCFLKLLPELPDLMNQNLGDWGHGKSNVYSCLVPGLPISSKRNSALLKITEPSAFHVRSKWRWGGGIRYQGYSFRGSSYSLSCNG